MWLWMLKMYIYVTNWYTVNKVLSLNIGDTFYLKIFIYEIIQLTYAVAMRFVYDPNETE